MSTEATRRRVNRRKPHIFPIQHVWRCVGRGVRATARTPREAFCMWAEATVYSGSNRKP